MAIIDRAPKKSRRRNFFAEKRIKDHLCVIHVEGVVEIHVLLDTLQVNEGFFVILRKNVSAAKNEGL